MTEDWERDTLSDTPDSAFERKADESDMPSEATLDKIEAHMDKAQDLGLRLMEDLKACALPENGIKAIEIRDDRVRSVICELMSEMLDNPDDCGIYPTSRFMWRVETYILNLLAETRDGWESERKAHEITAGKVADAGVKTLELEQEFQRISIMLFGRPDASLERIRHATRQMLSRNHDLNQELLAHMQTDHPEMYERESKLIKERDELKEKATELQKAYANLPEEFNYGIISAVFDMGQKIGELRSLRERDSEEIAKLKKRLGEEDEEVKKGELLANNRSLDEIRDFLEVDSVGYVSLEGMLSRAALPGDHYCTACWSGRYRIPVDVTLNKFTTERYQMYMFEEYSTAHE